MWPVIGAYFYMFLPAYKHTMTKIRYSAKKNLLTRWIVPSPIFAV